MLYLILVYLRSLKMAKRCHINICYMTTSYPILGSGQNIGKQNIESQNIERKISKAKYRNRRISKPQNIEVAKNRIAKKSNTQNIEIAKNRIAEYRMEKISKNKISTDQISNAKYPTQNIECKISK